MFRAINELYKHYPGRDWEEDKNLENGNYYCTCTVCKKMFVGHKRRIICFECSKKV
jgi:hypothetical protein